MIRAYFETLRSKKEEVIVEVSSGRSISGFVSHVDDNSIEMGDTVIFLAHIVSYRIVKPQKEAEYCGY